MLYTNTITLLRRIFVFLVELLCVLDIKMNYSFVQTEGIQFDNSILHKKKQYMMLHKYKYITI